MIDEPTDQLEATRTWVLTELQPEADTAAALALALEGHKMANDTSGSANAEALLHCAAEQLSFVVGEAAEVVDAGDGFGELEFLDDGWLIDPGARLRLFSVERAELVLGLPSSRAARDESVEQGERWESTADGPVQHLADGSERLYRHLSDTASNGDFTVRASLAPGRLRVATGGRGDTQRREVDMAVRLWDTKTGRRLWERRFWGVDALGRMAWAPDGKQLAVVGVHYAPPPKPDHATLYMLDAKNGRTLWRFASEEPQSVVPGGSPVPFGDVEWFSDSSRLVVAYAESLRVLDAATGRKGARISYGLDPNMVVLELGPRQRWVVAQQQLAGTSILLSLDAKHRVELGMQTFTQFSADGRYLLVNDFNEPRLIELTAAPKPRVLSAERMCAIGRYQLPLEACSNPG